MACAHLVEAHDRAVGFVENSDDREDLQAWCDACEQLFLREGEQTQAFEEFCDVRPVCVFCYATIKERHSPCADCAASMRRAWLLAIEVGATGRARSTCPAPACRLTPPRPSSLPQAVATPNPATKAQPSYAHGHDMLPDHHGTSEWSNSWSGMVMWPH